MTDRTYSAVVKTNRAKERHFDPVGHFDSTSRALGVSWDKSAGKWKAQLRHGGKNHHLGYFTEEQDAAAAYQAAREAAPEGRLEEHLASIRDARAAARKRARQQ